MKRGTPDHPKTLLLAAEIGCSRPTAVGYLELLWHWTARYAPQGDVGRWSDEVIESGVHWDGDRGNLIRALVDTGWLDPDTSCRLLVHDWGEHADNTTKKLLSRKGLRVKTLSRQRRDNVRTKPKIVRPQQLTPEPLPEPLPEPEPEPEPNVLPAPPARASVKPPAVKSKSWSREAAEDWEEHFGKGSSAPARIGAALTRLVKAHGWSEVRPVWQRYIAEKDPTYASPQDFAAKYQVWADGSVHVGGESIEAHNRQQTRRFLDGEKPLPSQRGLSRVIPPGKT